MRGRSLLSRSLRRLREVGLRATEVLPALGFGRPAGPPTEPVRRSETAPRPAEDVHPIHDQQHVDPGRRIEIDKPTG